MQTPEAGGASLHAPPARAAPAHRVQAPVLAGAGPWPESGGSGRQGGPGDFGSGWTRRPTRFGDLEADGALVCK